MKTKVYLPIAVSSGEPLPKEGKEYFVICGDYKDVGILDHGVFWNDDTRVPATIYLKETEIDIPTKEEREKELGDAINAAIKFKWQGILIKKVEIEKFKTEYIQQLNK